MGAGTAVPMLPLSPQLRFLEPTQTWTELQPGAGPCPRQDTNHLVTVFLRTYQVLWVAWRCAMEPGWRTGIQN
jgi:hypothetical protein